MNVKPIRTLYSEMTMFERNALFIEAQRRDDDVEMDAIISASPRVSASPTDFAQLRQDLLSLQANILVQKAEIWTRYLNGDKKTRYQQEDRLQLYILVTLSDAWEAVCNEIGIDAKRLEEFLFQDFLMLNRMRAFVEGCRPLAFSEKEAKEFYLNSKGRSIEFSFTIKNITKDFRKVLVRPYI